MNSLKAHAKTLPVIPRLYRGLRDLVLQVRRARADRRLRRKNTEQVFTEIYRRHGWGGQESVSGPGSDLGQTRVVLRELRPLLDELKVGSMLDIPCGDFHWMQRVDLKGIDYIGADIVAPLIQANRERHGRDGVRFQQLDLVKDDLPDVNLVLCRDCLIHLSFADIFRALDNLSRGASEYLLTTTYPARTENCDIVTGRDRVLNLERAPFAFPKPLRLIIEECTEGDGAFADKALGLWRIADIRSGRNQRAPTARNKN